MNRVTTAARVAATAGVAPGVPTIRVAFTLHDASPAPGDSDRLH
jgi:hypothetical protein